MDKIDIAILNELRLNARISNLDLAKKVNLSASAVLERVRKLHADGIIRSYEARLDHRKLGLGITLLIELVTDENIGEYRIAKALAVFPEIVEIYDVSGECSYLLKVVTADSDALRELMMRIGKIQGIRSSKTTLVLGMLKEGISPEVKNVRK